MLVSSFLSILILFNLANSLEESLGCWAKYFGYESTVCVCNSTYCDKLSPVSVKRGEFLQITSSKGGKRWSWSKSFKEASIEENEYDVKISIDQKKRFQKILGFGGAFTDASGFNLVNLPLNLQENVMKGYYGEDGLEYNLGRVPIGGTDFSTHPYTYDDLPPGQSDPKLKHFKIAKEDMLYKIPFILKAQKNCKERGDHLKLFSSPWSAPAWMKDNKDIKGKGKLLKKYYSVWANYFIKFFQFYRSKGIEFFATTPQNEPIDGTLPFFPFNSMGWLAEEQGLWIANFLGPTLERGGFANTTILIGDDVRFTIPIWVDKVMATPNASKYVGGVAVHWYWDTWTPTSLLDSTHEKHPHLPILYTEACEAYGVWDIVKVLLGSWVRAENYAEDIIENLNHWVVGWTDWNLALGLEGGPNWISNFVDSPVIVDKGKQVIYKQPMYYALAHFSKVFPEGSQKIGVSIENSMKKAHISVTGFQRPDRSFALTILNRNKFPIRVLLCSDNNLKKLFTLDSRSVSSVIWMA